jgi:heterodisulfide reductase subunit C
MALEKQIKVDKIEVVGEFKAVQVRTATVVSEDGTELSRSFSRHVIQAGDDYSSEDAEVQAVCAAVHTDEVIAAYEAHLATNQIGG